MGKSYVENSLKRFLKRKVKITLGVVVTFLITGAVSFAGESTVDAVGGASSGKWLAGIGESGKNLKAGKIENDKITVQNTEKGNITITFKDTNQAIEIKNEELSTEIIKNINEAMTNAEKAVDWKNNITSRENYEIGMNAEATAEGNKAVDGQIIVNNNNITNAEDTGKTTDKGEKLFAGQTVLGHGTAVNKGDIEITKDSVNYFGQYIDGEGAEGYNYGNIILKNETPDKLTIERAQNAVNGGKIYNYGYIEAVHHAQAITNGSKGYNYGELYSDNKYAQFIYNSSEGYNYGILNSKNGVGQSVDKNSIGYNYGLIKAGGQYGQYVGNNSEGYNYGVIINRGGNGQNIEANSLGYNYDIIANNGVLGQSAYGESTIYNYGLVSNNGVQGQKAENNSEAYNYGIIKNNGNIGQQAGVNSKVYNYGLISNTGNDGQRLYSSEGYNYGIIANNGDFGQGVSESVGYNYGVIANGGNAGMYVSAEAGKEASGYNIGIIANKGESNIGSYGEGKVSVYNEGILFNHNGQAVSYDINSKDDKFENNGIIVMKGDNAIGAKYQYNGQDLTLIGNSIEINAKDKNNILFSQIGENMFVATGEIDYKIYGKDEKASYNKYGEITVKDHIFNENLTENKNLFVDHYTKHKLTKEFNLKQDTLINNRITTIVGSDSSLNTAINHSGDLSLDKSTIVGYFEKAGTLLNVTAKNGKAGNLTLKDSFIGAYAGDTYTGLDKKVNGVYAVNLNGGSLNLQNSLILGGIKGEGHVNVEDAKDMVYENIYLNKSDLSDGEINFATTKDGEMKVGFKNSSVEGINLDFKGNKNELTLNDNVIIKSTGIDGANSEKAFTLNIGDGNIENENTINITGDIVLGKGKDVLNINNHFAHNGTIKGGTDDILNVNTFNQDGSTQEFNKNVENFSEINLKNGDWTIGEKGHIKGNNTAITVNGKLVGSLSGNSADVNTSLDGKIEGKAEINADKVRFDMGTLAINSLNDKYIIEKNKDVTLANKTKADVTDKISVSEIFHKKSEADGIHLTIKSAKEMGISNEMLYETILKNYGADKDIYDIINNGTEKEIASMFNGVASNTETVVTNGYKVTRDVTKGFMSAVNEFDKKADKGQWLTQAKYINSDTELDNNAKVKGYDGDINSMAAMAEYGITEKTSVGAVLGGGSTEIEMNNHKKLDGDNYFAGLYAKTDYNSYHAVGTIGYTLNKLDVDNGGSADSSALSIGGYVHRDIYITNSVKIVPNISAVYEYIDVDDAEMYNGIKTFGETYNVLDTSAGMDIAKEFAVSNGKLTLKTGAEYSYAFISGDENVEADIFGTKFDFGDSDLDKSRVSAHVGFDYEHTTGFGVNGKYETMWSDSGDDSRITAGISYRF
ncbi:MAG: autotransporter domain-containing protein [Fusobacterium sp.]|nr:autotransporter domain-containing protein [Fusobacterium sp.]